MKLATIRTVSGTSAAVVRGDELIEIVKILELGQMGLDESLKYWERGESLAKRCEEHLAGAARRVEQAISGSGDGANQQN